MTRLLLILSLSALACGTPVAPPHVTNTPQPQYTAPVVSVTPTYLPRHVTTPLTVRQSPCVPSTKAGYLQPGDAVTLTSSRRWCEDGGQWVELTGGGWVNYRYLTP